MAPVISVEAMYETLKQHWPEYLMEAWGLGIFMISACTFGVAFYHPASPAMFEEKMVRDVLMGGVMGATAIGIILSPWGKRSGAHINPSVTLTFWSLGKVRTADALFYALAQFAGAALGVGLSWLALGNLLENAAVNFVVTVPGETGTGAAFAGEFLISFLLMTMVLITTNSARLMKATPFLAGLLVANFIVFEGQFSGMSMNPARTFGSALPAGVWSGAWIYFFAPPLAMLSAAGAYSGIKGGSAVKCAKYHHHNRQRCIFCGKREAGTNGE